MARLGPEATDRAANMTRANNADFHLGTRGRLTQCGRRLEYPLEDEHSRTGQQRAASAINSDMIEHRHTNCELQDTSGFKVVHRIVAGTITRKVSQRAASEIVLAQS